MCSFIFSDKKITNLEKINFFNKFRGPDYTNQYERFGFSFIHNLLSITGNFTLQPFIDEDIICLYNGEIYEYEKFGNYKSDGECLIPLYKKYGHNFTKELDGEFAIFLIDFKSNTLVISSDTFKTKPIFYTLGKGNLSCSTYSSPLKELGYNDIISMPPNTTLVIDLKTCQVIESITVTTFNLAQYKDDVSDWIKAFEESIRKRTKGVREKLFIGLSGGYDSGAICCELLKQKIPFSSYTVYGTENEKILEERLNKMNNNVNTFKLTKTPIEIKKSYDYILKNTESFKFVTYSNSSSYNEYNLDLIDDNGAKHLSHVCSMAIKNGNKIFLSGQGADEIYSDYGFLGIKKYPHSNFGGNFPETLENIFPWPSFFNSSMESYLAKEEYVAGSYGIEARYPFLDKKVVQEFLNLKSEVKNSHYKSVLYYYLRENNYPFVEDEKIGF
jgi:asparagine synthetase B (glutamine-hydrolysing)